MHIMNILFDLKLIMICKGTHCFGLFESPFPSSELRLQSLSRVGTQRSRAEYLCANHAFYINIMAVLSFKQSESQCQVLEFHLFHSFYPVSRVHLYLFSSREQPRASPSMRHSI